MIVLLAEGGLGQGGVFIPDEVLLLISITVVIEIGVVQALASLVMLVAAVVTV